MLAIAAGVLWTAVVMHQPDAPEAADTLLDAFRTVVTSTEPDSMFQVLAMFGIATTVALENAIRSISTGQRQRDESDEQVHEAFVRRRATNFLVVVVGVLGGIAGFLGAWLVLPVGGDHQLLGIIYLLFGAFLWNEGRRLAIATRQDERLRIESAMMVSTLMDRILAVEKYRRRDGWLWLTGTVTGVSVTSMVTRLVLDPADLPRALILGAAAVLLSAGIAYMVLQTVGDHLEGRRLGLGVGVLLCAVTVLLWVMLIVVALLGAASDLHSFVGGLTVVLMASSALVLFVLRGALNSGIAAPISSLLLNRLRRTVERLQKGTGGSVADAFGGPGT